MKLVPGMDQKTAHKEAIQVLKNNNIDRWHDVYIQFGENTKYGYENASEKNDNNIVFNKNDVVFIDIGIVINKTLEGDYGQTFYRGENPKVIRMINMSKYFYEYGYQIWKNNRTTITGRQLYNEIGKEVKKYGYDFAIENGGYAQIQFPKNFIGSYQVLLSIITYGHPIGIFLHVPDELAKYDGIIEEDLWVLEILIFDPEIQRGAFYEDVLMLKDIDMNHKPKI